MFFCGERQVVAGIGWELVSATKKLGRPDLRESALFDFKVYSMLAEEAALAAGVSLHYHEILTGLKRENGLWVAESSGSMLKRTIRAKELIDCSGEAVAVRLAGGECQRPEERQPGTLEFNFDGFDAEKLDAELLDRRFKEAVAQGRLKREDFCYTDQPFINYLKRGGGGNFQHLLDVGAEDSAALTLAEIEGRQRLLRMYRFLRSIPGLEDCFLRKMDVSTGIREGWRIVGETTITREDYLSGRVFPDAVAWTYYFIDIHHKDGIEKKRLEKGVVPTIPLSALVPRGMDNLLVAGRLISSDRAAYSALRVQASCMAMGQAVGAAAALGAKKGVPSRKVDLGELRATLREQGALVPDPV
jgi:hypothetical protein